MSSLFPPEKTKQSSAVSVKELLEVPAEERSHNEPGWRPWTFSITILISAVFFTTSLVILLGILEWQNFRNGAIIMVATSDNFSNIQNFLYRYLPTMIIVLYSMGWSWIDLDVKRLEPWYQLAHREGAAADRSLLLQYPLDFLPLVPIKAAKKKQWHVFCSSIIMVLVVWGITPLQNGIFSNTVMIRHTNVGLHVSQGFLPLPQQDSLLGINILNQAYAAIWLGQELSPFTTPEYAIAPFKLTKGSNVSGSNQTLTATTNLYSTELDCRPPVSFSTDTGTVTLDDGAGCVAQEIFPIQDIEDARQFMSYYIGYPDDPHVDSSLQLAGCGQNATHKSLAVWKRTSIFAPNFDDPSNATALFCTATYYVQQVNATVSIPNQKVQSVLALGPKQPLNEAMFSMSQFEYVLASGAPPNTALNGSQTPTASRQDVIDTTLLHQDTQVINMSLVIPVPNMIAFAIGTTRLDPAAYLDPQTLHAALQKAYNMIFVFAMAAVMQEPDERDAVSGVAQSAFQTVSLVPVFSVLSQALLLTVAACTCALLYLTQNRNSHLAQDPDCLAQIMSLARGQETRKLFNRLDSISEDSLSKALKPYHFLLSRKTANTGPMIEYTTNEDVTSSENHVEEASASITSSKTSSPVKPFEYTIIARIGFLTSLTGMVGALVFLRLKIAREKGLPLVSENYIVQQLIFNFIPTSAATLLEPCFVLLSRVACLMQPLESLKRGNSTAKTSLLARYTSVPPQLVIWRAFCDGRILLACLCFLAVVANVLTLALSGIFSIEEVSHATSTNIEPLYQPRFGVVPEDSILSTYNQNDAFYVADSNFTTLTPLPHWTTPHYFIPPLDLLSSPSSITPSVEWTLQTQGYGADLECQELTQTPSNATIELQFGVSSNYVRILAAYTQSDGSMLYCKPGTSGHNATGGGNLAGANYTAVGGDPTGKKAFEMSSSMESLNSVGNNTEADPCNEFVVKGWIRVSDGSSAAGSGQSSENSAAFPQPVGISSTFISCKPRLKSAHLNVTVSAAGTVLMNDQASVATYETPFTALDVALNITRANFNSVTIPFWHNDTFATDWPNYLTKQFTQSTDFLNFNLPPPSVSAASNITSEVFSRLFAIQMSILKSQLLPAESSAPGVEAQLLTLQRRVFMSDNLFWIAIAILGLDFVVVSIFYLQLPGRFLPRLPTNVASQIAYFAGSHVIDDVQKSGGDLRELDKRGYRYGYGKYVGQDGWTHVGIERVPYVINLGGDQSVRERPLWLRFVSQASRTSDGVP